MIRSGNDADTQPAAASALAETVRVDLTEAERSALQALEPLRVCVDPDWEPYERVTPDGDYVGIGADLFTLVARRLGVRFEVVPTRDWEESLALAERGDCHLLPFLNRSRQRRTFLRFTAPVMLEPNVFVTRLHHPWIEDAAQLGDAVVALPRGTRVEERLRADYPALRLQLVDSESDALEAVRRGEATAALRSLTVAAHAIRASAWGDLRIAGQLPRYVNRFRIGVVRSLPLLHGLLERAVATLTVTTTHAIIARHVAVDHALLRDMATLADQARRASYQLRSVIDAVPNYIISLDAEGRTVMINRALCTALGIAQPADAIGQDLRALGISPEHAQALDALRIAALASGARRDLPAEPMRRPDGSPGTYQLSVTPYHSGDPGIDAVLMVATDVTERVELEQRIRRQAERDGLTTLLNRTAFAERVSTALAAARASQREVAIALVDLDDFKTINDRNGHAVGDHVLQRVAERLQAAVRPTDTVARLGGDEFALLLNGVRSLDDAVAVADAVRRHVAAPIAIAGTELQVGASIGVALHPRHGRDLSALLEAADRALYAVKAAGRGAVRSADDGAGPDGAGQGGADATDDAG